MCYNEFYKSMNHWFVRPDKNQPLPPSTGLVFSYHTISEPIFLSDLRKMLEFVFNCINTVLQNCEAVFFCVHGCLAG